MLSPQELRRQLTAEPLQNFSSARTEHRIEDLLDALSDQENLPSRQAAAAMLGQIGDSRAVKPLISALHDPIEAVSVAATRSLGAIGALEAVAPLLALLKYGSDAHRRSAAEALGNIGDPRAVEPLVAALEDPYHGVCIAALKALGRIGDLRAMEALVAALGHRDVCTRLTAAAALSEIAGPTRPRDRRYLRHPQTPLSSL